MPNFAEIRKDSEELFARGRAAKGISETSPSDITPAVLSFTKHFLDNLSVVRVPVVQDRYGLYGWCSDGVLEKIKNEGGSIRFGWAIWEWPNVMLTAEFHAVWCSPEDALVDITPKPQGQTHIIFVPDDAYPQDFDFDKRPTSRRCSIYPRVNASEVSDRIFRMKPAEIQYQQRYARKAGVTLEDWLSGRKEHETVGKLIDDLIHACNEWDRKMDTYPAGEFIADDELVELSQCKARLVQAVKMVGRR